MIDLSKIKTNISQVHLQSTVPGNIWDMDSKIVIDVPPDNEIDPMPETQWPTETIRTGIYGSVAPRVLLLPNGKYRMYYTQIMPRSGFPEGANDYGNATTRILSAVSTDGVNWTPESGVRLTSVQGGAGEFRVVSGDVVPLTKFGDRLRMYYECSNSTQEKPNSIRSAVSEDGLIWSPEPGIRFGNNKSNYMSPRIIFLDDGKMRLYCGEKGKGIISAISDDGGLTFHQESGIRIAADGAYDKVAAFAPEIFKLHEDGYIMFYAGYSSGNRAYILKAISDDGLTWHKQIEPVISPQKGTWGASKCSEMCLISSPQQNGETTCFRMVFEACDGTAKDERGVWRIASAKNMS